MRAATLRAPAGWRDAVRAQAIVLTSVKPVRWIIFLLIAAVGAGTAEFPVHEEQPPFGLFRFSVVMMFLLPLAWQGRGGGAGEAPLPVADTSRTLVRVVSGAVLAGVVFALGIGVYVLGARLAFRGGTEGPNPLHVFSPGYPVALTLAGVANYLLGAALMLRAERPGRVLLAGLVVAALLLGAAGIELDHVEFETGGTLDAPRYTGGSSLSVTNALLRLLLGLVAVSVAVWWDRLRLQRWRGPAQWRTRFPTPPARARTLPLAVPRAPASAATVFARHLLLLAPRMALPLLLAAYYAWVLTPEHVVYQSEPSWLRPREPVTRVITPEPLEILMIAGFLWPVLVWLDERRIQAWDDAHPIRTLSRRLLHAGAGLVWLQLVGLVIGAAFVSRAVRAGMLSSAADLPTWLWLGLPLGLLTIYCVGTAAIAGMDNTVLAGVMWSFCLIPVMGMIEMIFSGFQFDARPGPLAPTRLLTAVAWFGHQTEHWSTPAALLWTPVFVAAAVFALWFRAWRDQHGWSPSLLELIRYHRRPR